MNVKFRMPKFSRYLMGKTWQKELGLTIIGTTLSIILTFGTAQYFEYRNKVANGRQLAIMAIHDINNTVETLEQYANNVHQFSLKAQYLQMHLDSLENVGIDTIYAVFDYLLADNFYGQGYLLDDANEKVFLSSHDVWKNIDNATFIDRIQTFYNDRHDFYNYLSNSLEWQKPVEELEFIQRKMKTPDYGFDVIAYLKELLRREDVCYFIAYSSLRQQLFNSTAQKWHNVSDECKFLMGISDSEMEEYIKSQERGGKPISERQLLGRWQTKSKGDRNEKREQIMEFLGDHTASFTTFSYEMSHLYVGYIVTKRIARGTWNLQGDSVLITQSPELEYVVDTTAISYQANLKSEILKTIDQWQATFRKRQDEARSQGKQLIRRGVSIDQSETKMKWDTQYFTKQDE